jgi:hypothetical protein
MDIRFTNGLKQYNLTQEELINWKYCGGNTGSHLNYFRLCFGDKEPLPEHTNKCICGHPITENCYIENGEELIVLGSCCVKRFITKRRTCGICNEPHKNIKINRCNDCRVKCDKCRKEYKHGKFSLCSDCRKGTCDICSKKCNPNYNTCYTCKFSPRYIKWEGISPRAIA